MQAAQTMKAFDERREAAAPIDPPVRGRVSAWLSRALDRHLHRRHAALERELFGGLPRTVVGLGGGGGESFRHLDRGTHVLAVEPDVRAHPRLRAAAERHGVSVDVRAASAERLPLDDASVDAVISSLALSRCADPARALAEVRRVLRPGGRLWCLEDAGSRGRGASPGGAAPARDVARLLREAGFASVEAWPFALAVASVPVRAQLVAVAVR